MLVALPMRSRGTGSLVTVVSGTKISPAQRPATSAATRNSRSLHPGSRTRAANIAPAEASKPRASSLRESTLPVRIPTNGMNKKRRQPARQIRYSGMSCGITEQLLHEQGQQHGAAVEHESHHRHQKRSDGIGAVLEDAEIDDRMSGLQLANDEAAKANHRQHREGHE